MTIRTKEELVETLYIEGYDWINFYLIDGKLQWDWHLGSISTDEKDLVIFKRVNGLSGLTKTDCKKVAAKMYEKAECAIESPEFAHHIDVFDNI